MDEIIPSEFGDLWFVEGRDGDLIPMYSDANCEYAAIAAFLVRDYGALTTDEIEFMRSIPTL